MFMAEMGDRAQIATAALAAQFGSFFPIVLGTSSGMALANPPAVFFGHLAANRVPLKLIRRLAAAVVAVLGGWVLCRVAMGH